MQLARALREALGDAAEIMFDAYQSWDLQYALEWCRKVERYQQTLQREWAYALEYASSEARRASLPHWMRHYNERRTHSALSNRPPLQRVRDVTGLNS